MKAQSIPLKYILLGSIVSTALILDQWTKHLIHSKFYLGETVSVIQNLFSLTYVGNKAAAFGLLAYQSAWLLHYYPLEFYVGLFNNQPMGFYSLDTLVREAKRNKIPVLLPDVNKSDVWCMPEEGSIRLGIGFVRVWSEETATALVDEREAHGPFTGLGDLVRRISPGNSW